MAEAGAHFTSTAVNELPSIFEVLAQESLMETVRPALRHAVKVLVESNPARFGFLWRHFDELYLLLDVLLQNHFLTHCSASFSENLYGLKRVSGGRALPIHQGLRRTSQWRSLVLLCLVPYLRVKLEATLAQHQDEEDFSIRLARTRIQRLYRAAVTAYPYVSSAWQALVFCQQLLFVFGVSRTHSPVLWLARVKLARLNAQDMRDMELKTSSVTTAAEGSLFHRVWSLASQAVRGVAMSLSTSLSLGVFFLQFLEWWYSSDNQNTVKTLTSLPAPPPPLHLQQYQNLHALPDLQSQPLQSATTNQSRANPAFQSDSGYFRTCLLCRRVRCNSTVLSTSGFVFCYRCVYMYVKNHHRCPVTGYPTELQHLVKLYTPES